MRSPSSPRRLNPSGSRRVAQGPARSGEDGFALVAALIACMLLLAIGMLVIYLSTQDLRSSATTVGDKKALAAVDTGIHRLFQNFDPDPGASTSIYNTWTLVDSATDPNTRYWINTPVASSSPAIALPGYSIEAGQGWGMTRYDVSVFGNNTAYESTVRVDVGMGYGPVPTGTSYR